MVMRIRMLLVVLASMFLFVAEPVAIQAFQNGMIDRSAADRDLAIADFYRRAGNIGSAKFYYRLVQQRYPGTTQANNATQRLANLD
jgi:TolA-binding protein